MCLILCLHSLPPLSISICFSFSPSLPIQSLFVFSTVLELKNILLHLFQVILFIWTVCTRKWTVHFVVIHLLNCLLRFWPFYAFRCHVSYCISPFLTFRLFDLKFLLPFLWKLYEIKLIILTVLIDFKINVCWNTFSAFFLVSYLIYLTYHAVNI